MCGITGFTNFKKNIKNSNDLLKKMTEKLSKRGENEIGYYTTDNVYLGHRRLSIIDITQR